MEKFLLPKITARRIVHQLFDTIEIIISIISVEAIKGLEIIRQLIMKESEYIDKENIRTNLKSEYVEKCDENK